MSDTDKTPPTPASDPGSEDMADEIARALGMTEDAVRARSPEGAGHVQDAGPIELDKDGALIGHKKLQPKRAHDDGDTAAELDEELPNDPDASGKPRKAALPPKLSLLRPPEVAAEAEDAALEAQDIDPRFTKMIDVPAGTFLFGEDGVEAEVPAFRIDAYPVTNRQYEAFVRATDHRPPLYWPNGHLAEELADHPVVGLDYFDAVAYARWQGKDLPFEDEWERAARGTDGRTYPWGEENDLGTANTARANYKMTVPVDTFAQNVSPVGCQDMVGNAWELTHSPAPGGGVVVRGGSWYDFVLYAKTWFRFAAATDARNGTIGFRCVERDVLREAPREVDPAQLEAEITARTGALPPVDRASWNVEKRDLVPDFGKLRTLLGELQAERIARGPMSAPAPAVSAPDPVDSPLTPDLAAAPEPASDDAAAAAATLLGGVVDPEPALAEGEFEAPARTPTPPGEDGREHVEDVRDPGSREATTRDPATGGASSGDPLKGPTVVVPDTHAIQRAAEEVAQAETAARAASTGEAPAQTSRMLWGLLALGFLLVGGIVAALVAKSDDGTRPGPGDAPTRPGIVPADELSKLPPMPSGNAPVDPFRVFDAAGGELPPEVAQGNWLLVFVDPEVEGALTTIQSTTNIALRMHASGTRVALVMPRRAYELNGELPEGVQLEEQVQASWRMNGLAVVLDADAKIRTRFLNDRAGTAAIVTHEGQLEAKAFAPKPEGQFDVHSLAPLALTAHGLSPNRDGDGG